MLSKAHLTSHSRMSGSERHGLEEAQAGIKIAGRNINNLRYSDEEYTEELYKKDLHDPDNHDNVITNLEPDILECEVKWAESKEELKNLLVKVKEESEKASLKLN